MSTAKPMSTADREARYQKQNGRHELTPRQQRQIRKTTLRLEHGRHRTHGEPTELGSGRSRDGRGRTPTGCVTSIAASYVACAVRIVEPSWAGTRRDGRDDHRPSILQVWPRLGGHTLDRR